jgi:hypothetical protein
MSEIFFTEEQVADRWNAKTGADPVMITRAVPQESP